MHDVIEIRRFTQDDSRDWDDFVLAHPQGSIFHRALWNELLPRIQKTECCSYLTYCGKKITGILPLHYLRSIFFGNRLISVPYLTGGGELALDMPSRNLLAAAAMARAVKYGVKAIEWRSSTPQMAGWTEKTGIYCHFSREIAEDPEVRLKNIPRKKRADLRKILSISPQVQEAPLSVFLELYACTLHRHGTPMQAYGWYAAIAEALGTDCEIRAVFDRGTAVASLMSFYHQETVYPYFIGSRQEARAQHAMDYLYWDLMQHALTRGIRIFDFGRSKKGTGPYHYKRHWGFQPQELTYRYWLASGQKIPELNPLLPKFLFLSKIWRRLPPLMIRQIGPLIARKIG